MAELSLESSFNMDENPRKQSIIRRSPLSWLSCSPVGGSCGGRPPNKFTIRMEPGVLDYTRRGPSAAADVFKKGAIHINNLRSTESTDVTDDELVTRMAIMVYGSNKIERVGSDRAETDHLCRKIFLGEGLSDSPPRSAEYKERLEAYIRSDTQSDSKIKNRREVINHAMTFMYMVDAIIRENRPFSEDLVKEAHAILCSDIPVVTGDNETIESDVYAGQYRTRHVAAGTTNFVTPNRIGQAMTTFIDELNGYLLQAEQKEEIDPFFIAAHACGEFVNIHPFLDGNGRVCRIILNALLLKYAGIVCPIGRDGDECKEYFEIAKRRSDQEQGNGELAWYVLQQSMVAPEGSETSSRRESKASMATGL